MVNRSNVPCGITSVESDGVMPINGFMLVAAPFDGAGASILNAVE
jgi:hypothetical protein